MERHIMYMTGFADEAGKDLATQMRVTRELGWHNIEARNVEIDGESGNLHDISDKAFAKVVEQLGEAGLSVNCFGSAIGNYKHEIDDPFDITLEEVRRCIPRMQRLGSKMVRMMSYAVRKRDDGADHDDQMDEERFRRLREILRMFTDAGVVPVHENCMNYGGMSWKHTLRMIENVPGLKLVFDTGNPVFTNDRNRPAPQPKQSAWEFYEQVREHVAYIHIKDGRMTPDRDKPIYCYPGEGDGEVRRIMADMLARGYDGGVSIEPHMAAVHHDPNEPRKTNAAEIYIEYGRRMERLIAELKAAGSAQ
ncbi:MAG: sugar phosphate isomerase/epimerase family protein [Kiritimatiellia bacterium]|nr:sugar phosphate isomerase/epimerase [Lentisphaerota bacterium]